MSWRIACVYLVSLDELEAFVEDDRQYFPGYRRDRLEDAHRCAAAQGLDRHRSYTTWVPSPHHSTMLEFTQYPVCVGES